MRKASKFRTVLLWIGRLLIGSSVVRLVIATVFAIETATFVLRAQHATAWIIRLDQAYTVRSMVATNPPGFDVGESANVLYLPSNPSGARIASFCQLWFISVVLGFIGVINGILGGCLTFFARRQRNATAVPA